MTDTKRLLRVFLCHTSGDKPAVNELYEHLVNDGIDAWFDIEKLIPGQNWEIEITNAVKNSDVVIVCLSHKSITKEGFVQKEIRFALDKANEKPDGTIFIIPARLENCEVPEIIRKYHWVDLFSDDGYERLTKALQMRANNLNLIVRHKRKSIKQTIEIYPEVTDVSQNPPQISHQHITPLPKRKTWYRKTYETLIEYWLVSTLISTVPAWWFAFVEIFGENFSLLKDGIFSQLAFNVLIFLFVVSFVFTLLMALADKYDEKAKKAGQIILNTMLESVSAINHSKLRRLREYINAHYGERILNPFLEATQPRSQIENVLLNMQVALSQITGIHRDDISISIIYKTDNNPLWQWLCTVNTESDLYLTELITNPYSTAKQIIDGKADFIFFPDKKVGIQQNQYVAGKRDISHRTMGSILCKNISLGTNYKSIQAILSIATYGLQICLTDDYDAIQKITSIFLPPFEKGIQLEFSFLYIKDIMSMQKTTNKY